MEKLTKFLKDPYKRAAYDQGLLTFRKSTSNAREFTDSQNTSGEYRHRGIMPAGLELVKNPLEMALWALIQKPGRYSFEDILKYKDVLRLNISDRDFSKEIVETAKFLEDIPK